MHDIKFRAKAIPSGEFVYGFLTTNGESWYIISFSLAEDRKKTEVDVTSAVRYSDVNDRKGNEVYENDLIADDLLYVVKYGHYFFKEDKHKGWYMEKFDEPGYIYPFTEDDGKAVELIGSESGYDEAMGKLGFNPT